MENSSDDDYVQCQLCFEKFKAITGIHLQRRHNISLMTYKQMFPNTPVYTPDTYQKIKNGGIRGGNIIKQKLKNKRPTIHKHIGSLNKNIIRKIKKRDNNTCRICENRYSTHLEVHHIIRRTFFNNTDIADNLDNLISLCLLHHSFFEDFPARAYILFDKLQTSIERRKYFLSQATIPENINYEIIKPNSESQELKREEYFRLICYPKTRQTSLLKNLGLYTEPD